MISIKNRLHIMTLISDDMCIRMMHQAGIKMAGFKFSDIALFCQSFF